MPDLAQFDLVVGSGLTEVAFVFDSPLTAKQGVVVAIEVNPDTTITPPAGFTFLSPKRTNGTHNAYLYKKTAAGSETGFTFTLSDARIVQAICLVFNNSTTTGFVDDYDGAATAGLSHTAPSVDSTVVNTTLVGFWFASSALTAPGDMSPILSGQGFTASHYLAAQRSLAGIGASGSKAATTVVSAGGECFLLALAPNQPPSAPSGLSITGDISGSTSDRQAIFAWTPSVDPESESITYNIYYASDGVSFSLLAPSVAASDLTVNTTNFSATTLAKFRVEPVDASGNVGTAATSAAFTIEHHPSVPIITAPLTGVVITQGVDYLITWTLGTDPNSASNLIQTRVYLSDNGGASYGSPLTTTAGGATSYLLTTTGRTPDTDYRIKLVHIDETGLLSGDAISALFEIRADVAPLAPTLNSPVSAAVVDRAQVIPVSATFNDPGDTPSEAKLRLATSAPGLAGVTPVVIPIGSFTGNNMLHNIAGGSLAAGLWFYDLQMADLAGTYGPTAQNTFTAADKPSAIVFTSPTALSPPTTARVSAAWTGAGDAFRLFLKEGGVIVWPSGEQVSGATTYPIAFDLQNGHTYTLEGQRRLNGLWSDLASVTFTVIYTGPAMPEVDTTGFPDREAGYVLVEWTNSDSPDEIDVLRYDDGQTLSDSVKLNSSPLLPNSSMPDYTAASEKIYWYVVRAKDTTLNLVTYSEAKSGSIGRLHELHIHALRDPEGTHHAFFVPFQNQHGLRKSKDVAYFAIHGSAYPLREVGEGREEELTTQILTFDSREDIDALNLLFEEDGEICVRDMHGIVMFTGLDGEAIGYEYLTQSVPLSFRRTNYEQARP